jgi:hypothetical protein
MESQDAPLHHLPTYSIPVDESRSIEDTRPRLQLLDIPKELRLQIWSYAIPQQKELRFCPCLDLEPSISCEQCVCFNQAAEPLRNFAYSPDDPCSSLPLVSRQCYEETRHLLSQPHKTCRLCSPACMSALFKSCNWVQLQAIEDVRLEFDIRGFHKPFEMSVFMYELMLHARTIAAPFLGTLRSRYIRLGGDSPRYGRLQVSRKVAEVDWRSLRPRKYDHEDRRSGYAHLTGRADDSQHRQSHERARERSRSPEVKIARPNRHRPRRSHGQAASGRGRRATTFDDAAAAQLARELATAAEFAEGGESSRVRDSHRTGPWDARRPTDSISGGAIARTGLASR